MNNRTEYEEIKKYFDLPQEEKNKLLDSDEFKSFINKCVDICNLFVEDEEEYEANIELLRGKLEYINPLAKLDNNILVLLKEICNSLEQLSCNFYETTKEIEYNKVAYKMDFIENFSVGIIMTSEEIIKRMNFAYQKSVKLINILHEKEIKKKQDEAYEKYANDFVSRDNLIVTIKALQEENAEIKKILKNVTGGNI